MSHAWLPGRGLLTVRCREAGKCLWNLSHRRNSFPPVLFSCVSWHLGALIKRAPRCHCTWQRHVPQAEAYGHTSWPVCTCSLPSRVSLCPFIWFSCSNLPLALCVMTTYKHVPMKHLRLSLPTPISNNKSNRSMCVQTASGTGHSLFSPSPKSP